MSLPRAGGGLPLRLHLRPVAEGEWTNRSGLPVTRPARIASDLLSDHEDPGAVARVVADAIRGAFDKPSSFVGALAPHAARMGQHRADGLGLFAWLLGLVGDPDTARWLDEAQAVLVDPAVLANAGQAPAR